MSQSIIQRSFAGGEIAPVVGGRADQVKYQTGLRTCRNFRVRKEGGVELRTGTQFTKEIKDSAAGARFLKFVYNDEQSYVIEMGHGYFRFYRENARIVVSGVAAWSNVTAYVVGDLASRLGVNYYCVLAHTNQQPPNATYWAELIDDIYEIPTPYTIAHILATAPRIRFFQSGDVVTITHPSYDARELRRTGHTAWTLTVPTFAPSMTAPSGVTNSGAAGTGNAWVVTALKSETYEESLPSTPTTTSASLPITVTIPAVAGAAEYNVYREYPAGSGIYGFVGSAQGSPATFADNVTTPDTSVTPPMSRNPFSGADNRPSVGTIYQQRRILANTNNRPETIEGSRSGMFSNFAKSSPLQDDDAITFTVAGKKVQAVRDLIEVEKLIVLTAGGAWIVNGNADGALVATQPANPQAIQGSAGANTMPAILVKNAIVYVQSRGSVVNDLRADITQGYAGRDLTVFASHLFRGRTLTRWDFAESPDSIIYIVRSDGVMLGLTYLREHEIWGWHWHDTDGEIEDVVCVPEGEYDAVYVIVKRTIDGATKRYIERFHDPFIASVHDIAEDAFYVDSGLTYNGWNTGATTMRLSSEESYIVTEGDDHVITEGGDDIVTQRFETPDGWTYEDELTVTSSVSFFVAGDVGNSIVLRRTLNGEDFEATVVISEYVDGTHVKGRATKTVPAALREVALTTWGKGVDRLAGLGHLEGKSVAVLADGNVIASPNNPSYVPIMVESAEIALSNPYVVIHVGLAIVGDFATLDIDVNGEQLRDRMKNITGVSLLVESSRGIFAGTQFPESIPDDERVDEDDLTEGLNELAAVVDPNNDEFALQTGVVEISIQSTWEQSGRICVRQVDPLPLTILAAIPNGEIGG